MGTTTTITTPPIGAPNSAGQPTTIRDQLFAIAKDTPDLIAKAELADPDLATLLTGQSALGSRALYGPLLAAALTYAATKYGLGWDAATVNAVTGVLSVAVGMLFRVLAKAPITSVLPQAPKAAA